ncbi:hypothetical protein [Natronoglycomyces albus]|uniref:hypothetical protein n=1 Tax=Natronoglycomyces albus TaxID=2811108 RepID=UPI001FEA5986|nr:hypothetical protein [Natronoglycomyces albus]
MVLTAMGGGDDGVPVQAMPGGPGPPGAFDAEVGVHQGSIEVKQGRFAFQRPRVTCCGVVEFHRSSASVVVRVHLRLLATWITVTR